MRHDCLITSRLAGPCATCRQAAWPAHVRGLLIYCEACCGCGRGGAQAPGRDAAGPGHDAGPVMRHEAGPRLEALAADRGPSENMPGIRPLAGAVASARGGKGRGTTPRETGPFCALSGPARSAPIKTKFCPPERAGISVTGG